MFGLIGTLGKVPFICSHDKVFTFTDLKKAKNIRWARHEVIGKKPTLEHIGEDLSQVTFNIRFDLNKGFPPIVGLRLLGQMAERSESFPLIIGGEYYGKFVINSISEERKYFSGAGVCMIASASLSLTEVS